MAVIELAELVMVIEIMVLEEQTEKIDVIVLLVSAFEDKHIWTQVQK